MGWTATGRIRVFARVVVCIAVVGLFPSRATAGQFGFVYALQQVNGGANQIHGFRIDETTGTVTALTGFPMPSGGNGTLNSHSEQLAYFNGRLYVVNNGSDTLTAFTVNASTGALTAMPFSPVALGAGNWACVAVHQTGSPVVVGDSAGALASFVVNDSSATAAAGSPFSTGGASPFSCRFAQGGAHVYTGGTSGNVIAGFVVNASNGILSTLAGSPFDSGAGNPLAFASDNSGRLFSTSFSAAQVRVFTTSGGTLTGVTGNPFASGLVQGIQGVLHPAGFYMVADRSGAAVGVFQIVGSGSATTLAAVSGSPFPGGGSPIALALTPSGTHLIAANGNSRSLSVFTVNPASGALSGVSTQPTNALGSIGTITGLVFAPGEAGLVYSVTQVDGGANQIYGYRINPSTGALTALPGFPIASGGTGGAGAVAEQIAYRNGRLYVLNDGSNTVSAFKVNRSTGALTPLPFSPIAVPAGGLACVAIHPSGSPVVVGNSGTGITSINVGATSFSLAAGSPFESVASFSCGFSQDGNYVYTGGAFGNAIYGFSVNTGTGVLTPLAGSPFDAGTVGPASYATDSAGRLFTASVNSPSELRAFTTAAGIPTAVSGNPFPSGLNLAVHGILHPAGFYMAAGRNNANIGVFKIAGAGAATTLDDVFGSPFATAVTATATAALTTTTNGAYLVAAHGTSRNLTVLQVSPGTGSLATVAHQSTNTLGAAGRVTGVTFAAAVPPFNDDPLTALPALSRVIKVTHIAELRSRIDAVRAQYGFAPYAYTDPTLTAATTVVKAAHISDLRTALAEVYTAAGIAPPSYTDPALSSGTIVVKAAHITELRSAVIAVE